MWTKTDDGWAYRAAGEGEVVELSAVNASLDVAKLYDAAAAPNA
ncbi:MAG: hypothetical protein AAGN82_32465 [Myxococcota bacterium]